MKALKQTLTLALAGLLFYSCTEELSIEPETINSPYASASAVTSSGDVIDFESLNTGDIAAEVYSANGAGPVSVWGTNPNHPDSNAAMIFDSSNPTGNDWDLGTPNEDFGGPGIGTRGESDSPYANDVSLGKVLIITEDFDSNDPDDADLNGSSFSFDFSALGSVSVYSMYIMDVETSENAATVSFYDHSGSQIGNEFVLPRTGNNGLHLYEFGSGVDSVVTMTVNINGSGVIDNLAFVQTETPPSEEPRGCTYTAGYWKNHTKYGAPKRDDTWDKIGAEAEDTRFFLSDQSYLEVMKTSKKGNGYYILAFQYIAAKLNVLAGASAPDEVTEAITESEKLFGEYTPEEISRLKGNNTLRKEFLKYAELFDDYNNGRIGPGHCD